MPRDLATSHRFSSLLLAQYVAADGAAGRARSAGTSHVMGTSREARERLIDEVRRCPVLYDTRHEQHRDVDVRDRCWHDIAARLGANSEDLKREWKILRDSLRQAIKKSRGDSVTKTGAPRKKWRFQARMAFLIPYMTRRLPRAGFKSDMKVDYEADEEQEWGAVGDGGDETTGGAGAGAGAGALDSLELFFAAVCAGARRLPAPAQRGLQRRVLDALLRAEEEAELGPAGPAPTAGPAVVDSSKTEVFDEF